MNFIVKLFPEITIKSAPVRRRMSRQLTENLRLLLKRQFDGARVKQEWDKLEVAIPGESEQQAAAVADVLACIPGIANFSRVRVYPLGDLEDIYRRTYDCWAQALAGKTFCVRVKRNGQHPFTSTDVERYVGGGLNQHSDALGVRLREPDETVNLEIHKDTLYVVDRKYPGLGGFPLGTQEAVLSLVSGGFDSTVASYQCIKRGLRTHYLFFNLGGAGHEVGVKEIAYYLWSRYGASHRVKFISVPFQGVVEDILANVDRSAMGVVLKRLMMRAASRIADRADISAVVTGEAVSQVSSQTLTNLSIIDRVCEPLVLRPLVLMDKGKIIETCREIGAEDFAANIPEYCGVISVRPSAHLRLHKVEAEEAKLNPDQLTQALAAAEMQSIDQVVVNFQRAPEDIPCFATVKGGQQVIDIRHPHERDGHPLDLSGDEVLAIPFYSLDREFAELDKGKEYLLYCDKGVMSQMHAVHLRDQGFANVAVFRPSS